MAVMAIVPARGGSKGIPRKNLRMVGGKPLIVHAIDAAAQARRVDRMAVSTDDPEIAAISRRAGAEVIMRPAEIATDTASSESALLHALDDLEAREGSVPDRIVFLQCTSPLTVAADIDGLLDRMDREGADSGLVVCPFHHFVWQATEGGAGGLNHDSRFRPRRQDRGDQYLEAGSVYAMRTDGFRTMRHRFFGRIAMHPIDAARVFEIDEPDDLDLAEQRFAMLRRRTAAALLPRRVALVVTDFDGVWTDDRVIVAQDGSESVICSRGDGLGLERLIRAGFRLTVLSKERNAVVAARCRKTGIPCHHGVDDKAAAFSALLLKAGVDPAETIYVGNDVNDLGAMALAGCAVAPADARPVVREAAHIVLERGGGRGALRELCDLLIAACLPAEPASPADRPAAQSDPSTVQPAFIGE
jgi:YrbI family 3-deoxy-D-manno-octulosonate 8-phosphate phosphatase